MRPKICSGLGIKKLILFLGITISIFSILGGTTGIQNVSGDGNIDQSFTGPFSGQVAGIGDGSGAVSDKGQEFTPTASNLIAVDIFMSDGPQAPVGFSETVTVNIRPSTITTAPIGTTSKTVTSTGAAANNPRVEHFDFSSPISLTSCMPICVIEVIGSSLPTKFGWVFLSPGTYPGGVAINPGLATNADFGFATYQSILVGGELIPLDTTIILLAGTQMTAAWMIPVIVSGIGIAIVIARKF